MIRVTGAVFALLALFVPAASHGLAAAEVTPPPHHAAHVRIDPESRRLTIDDVVTVSGRTEIPFQIATWLRVERLLVDGRPIATPGGSWKTVLPDRRSHRIEVRLQGTVPALRPNARGGTGQSAALGLDGGYLFESANWLPATDDDLVTWRLWVEVPAPYLAVATGRRGDEKDGGTAYRATFEADFPSAPPALFVGPYAVREIQQDNIRIRTYFYRDQVNLADAYLRDTARYLARYQTLIGPYPYGDFSVVSAPVPVGLGFPSLTYVGRRILPLPFLRGRSLAHEVLHSWWGNGIAVDYRGGNWSEGLTTYMADYALAAEQDAEQGRQMRLGWLRDYAALPADRDVPVTRFTAKHNEAAQVVGYNKVAFIFHMLKLELGEATFTAALRLFWQRWRHRTAGWEDLRHAFEAASGRDLGWFFEQWLTRAGAPRLELARATVEGPADDGTYRVRLTVRQDRPAYRLTVPVVIETEAGRRTDSIEMRDAETTVTLETRSRPRALHLDRAHDLFRRLLPGEAPPILRDVTLASDAVTVITAENRALRIVARHLADRLLDRAVRPHAAEAAPSNAAVLIIGLTREIAPLLARQGLAPIPAALAGRGTARVWTATRRNGRPLLVVAADDGRALEALLQPLPHYGGRSYLVFNGRRVIDKGVWPATRSPLSRRFN